MSEVEHVTGSAVRPPQHVIRARRDDVPGREADRGLEVALYRAVADRPPRFVERNAPVHADGLAFDRRDERQQTGVPGREVDARHPLADLGEEPARVWEDRAGVVLSPKRRLFAEDRKSTRLNSSHTVISYAVFCLKKKKADGTEKRGVTY